LIHVVLFSSFRDAGRGPLAAAIFNSLADPAKARACSAGLSPAAAFNPLLLRAVEEAGLVLASAEPQGFTAGLLAKASILIHLGPATTGPAGATLWDVPFVRRAAVGSMGALHRNLEFRIARWLELRRWLRPGAAPRLHVLERD
jgi:hypothetical protein